MTAASDSGRGDGVAGALIAAESVAPPSLCSARRSSSCRGTDGHSQAGIGESTRDEEEPPFCADSASAAFEAVKPRRRRGKERLKQPPRNKDALPVDIQVLQDPSLETRFVSRVYDRIADHFSNTRYKPWPKVKRFLETLPVGALVVDAGCGNGKYLNCRPENTTAQESDFAESVGFSSLSIGLDISMELLKCAQRRLELQAVAVGASASSSQGRLLQADCLHTGIRDGVADAAISIAVLHHLSSEQRRVEALRELCRITRPGGKILVYVWAWEQTPGTIGCRSFAQQDVFVPWHMPLPVDKLTSSSRGGNCQTEKRPSEQTLVDSASSLSLNLATRVADPSESMSPSTLYRYYHVFTRQELLTLCDKAGGMRVLDCYLDANNWAVVLQRV